jgi:hypothetical protein
MHRVMATRDVPPPPTQRTAGKGCPGFESPMLHPNLNSELALEDAECQDLEHLTTKADH